MTNIRIANRLEAFPENIFSRMNKLLKEIEQASGKKVINLGRGSPDFPPSQLYVDKYAEFIRDQCAHLYPEFGANDAFTKALISWYKIRFGVELNKDELFPLLGAKDGTSHIVLAVLDEGNEALIPDPGYPGFSGPTILFGAKPVYYTLHEGDGFSIDIEELKEKITSQTKCLWVNFPSNPTGQVATLKQLEPIVTLARERNVLLIYDNAYSEITFNGFVAPSILQIEGAKDIAVEIGSFSKTFSFAGYRMGWIVGNKDVIKALAKVKSQLDSGLSMPLQNLGAYALTHPDNSWHNEMITSYQERRDKIAQKFASLGLTFTLPKGGLYIWAKIPDGQLDSEKYALNLLKEKQILVTPGIAFGENGKNFIRASICANIKAIDDYL